jgi:hypothetical protein
VEEGKAKHEDGDQTSACRRRQVFAVYNFTSMIDSLVSPYYIHIYDYELGQSITPSSSLGQTPGYSVLLAWWTVAVMGRLQSLILLSDPAAP